MSSSVSIESLSVRYKSSEDSVLSCLSLWLPGSSKHGLVGNNGSGKSTFAQALIGITSEIYHGHVQGVVKIDSCSLLNLNISDRLRYIGYSSQDYQSQILFGTVEDILGLKEEGTDQELVNLGIEFFQIRHLLHRLPNTLSGGEAQKVALVTALRCGPDFIIYDEATTALDPSAKRDFLYFSNALVERDHCLLLIGQRPELLAPYVNDFSTLRDRHIISGFNLPELSEFRLSAWESLIDSVFKLSVDCGPVSVTMRDAETGYSRSSTEFQVGPVNLDIEAGEILGLIGKNGSGKSSILDLVSGFLSLKKGEIIYSLSKKEKIIKSNSVKQGYLHQNPSQQLLYSTLEEEIFSSLSPSLKIIKDSLKDNLSLIFPFLNMKYDPLDLSYGEQKMIALLSNILHRHNLLLLDEPEQGLDQIHIQFLKKWIQKVRIERNITILLSTHDMDLAVEFCDRIAVIENGKVCRLLSKFSREDLDVYFE